MNLSAEVARVRMMVSGLGLLALELDTVLHRAEVAARPDPKVAETAKRIAETSGGGAR